MADPAGAAPEVPGASPAEIADQPVPAAEAGAAEGVADANNEPPAPPVEAPAPPPPPPDPEAIAALDDLFPTSEICLCNHCGQLKLTPQKFPCGHSACDHCTQRMFADPLANSCTAVGVADPRAPHPIQRVIRCPVCDVEHTFPEGVNLLESTSNAYGTGDGAALPLRRQVQRRAKSTLEAAKQLPDCDGGEVGCANKATWKMPMPNGQTGLNHFCDECSKIFRRQRAFTGIITRIESHQTETHKKDGAEDGSCDGGDDDATGNGAGAGAHPKAAVKRAQSTAAPPTDPAVAAEMERLGLLPIIGRSELWVLYDAILTHKKLAGMEAIQADVICTVSGHNAPNIRYCYCTATSGKYICMNCALSSDHSAHRSVPAQERVDALVRQLTKKEEILKATLEKFEQGRDLVQQSRDLLQAESDKVASRLSDTEALLHEHITNTFRQLITQVRESTELGVAHFQDEQQVIDAAMTARRRLERLLRSVLVHSGPANSACGCGSGSTMADEGAAAGAGAAGKAGPGSHVHLKFKPVHYEVWNRIVDSFSVNLPQAPVAASATRPTGDTVRSTPIAEATEQPSITPCPVPHPTIVMQQDVDAIKQLLTANFSIRYNEPPAPAAPA